MNLGLIATIKSGEFMSTSYLSQHHSFDVDLATKLGSCELAILVHHFVHWIKYNEKLGRNLRDGKYWTYQTRNEICAHFTYWTPKQVRTLLDKLVSLDILIKGNYNTSLIDHTTWFTLNLKNKILAAHLGHCSGVSTEAKKEDLSGICPNGPTSAQTGKCIPDTKTTNTKEQQQLVPEKEVVVVVSSEEDEKKQKDLETAQSIASYLISFSKVHGDQWKISEHVILQLIKQTNRYYVSDQLNYMCNQQRAYIKDLENNEIKKKKPKVQVPSTFLCLACVNNYAMSPNR